MFTVDDLKKFREDSRDRVRQRAQQIRAEHRKIASEEIREFRGLEGVWFAGKIRKAIEAGLSREDIRREVLRTNDWGTWVKWAELAGVDPSMRNDKGVAK